MMKNAFYFTSKDLSVLKMFKFLFSIFGCVAKQLETRDKVNFNFYDFTAWLVNNRNKHVAQNFEK